MFTLSVETSRVLQSMRGLALESTARLGVLGVCLHSVLS